MNWYPEPIESSGTSVPAVLLPTPGVTSLSEGTSNPGRAHFFENGREFAVIGTIFYEIDSNGVLTSRGTVALDNNPATISSNGDGGDQLLITSGTNAYYYVLSTDVLTQITVLDGKATMGDQLDGYFLVLDGATSTFYISALLDGSSWTLGTDFAQRSVAPDPWISMKVHGRYVWLLGEQTSEAWYNTGDRFPFGLHSAGFIRHGIAAPFSVAVAGEAIYWLASSVDGDGYVLRLAGFEPQIVSHFAVQTAINNYTTISDAQAYAYSDFGHTFYVLNFLSENETWALDSTTQIWAERGTWVPGENRYVAWRPRWHALAFGEHRTLDAETGNVYRMSPDILTDVGGLAIRRLRRAPVLNAENERLFFSSFELDLEIGLGTQLGQGFEPQIMLRMSNDGGKTWGNEHWRSAGKAGEYGARAEWNRLGQARKRVFEVVVTDPIKWRILGAYFKLAQPPRASLARAG